MTALKDPLRNILVPIDFSESSEKAAAAAAALSAKDGATVHLLHAYVIPVEPARLALAISQPYLDQFVRESTEHLKALAERQCAGAVLGPLLVESGDPREVILETARKLNADLIVMGTHGRRGLSRAVIGSVAENVVRTAPCSVLVVR